MTTQYLDGDRINCAGAKLRVGTDPSNGHSLDTTITLAIRNGFIHEFFKNVRLAISGQQGVRARRRVCYDWFAEVSGPAVLGDLPNYAYLNWDGGQCVSFDFNHSTIELPNTMKVITGFALADQWDWIIAADGESIVGYAARLSCSAQVGTAANYNAGGAVLLHTDTNIAGE